MLSLANTIDINLILHFDTYELVVLEIGTDLISTASTYR
jgi:hypothetical protein